MFDLKKAVEEANCACYPHMFSQANSEANLERRAAGVTLEEIVKNYWKKCAQAEAAKNYKD